jgi:hypothetical protein
VQKLPVLIRAELRPDKHVWIWPHGSLVIHPDGIVEWDKDIIEESEARMMVAEFLSNQAKGKVFVN